jgi:hypothetical protein
LAEDLHGSTDAKDILVSSAANLGSKLGEKITTEYQHSSRTETLPVAEEAGFQMEQTKFAANGAILH